MPTRFGINRPNRSSIVLRSRLRDLTSRMRTNAAVQRVGKWFDGLQADLRGAAQERIHEAGTLATRVARQLLAPAQSGPRAIVNATGILTLAGAELPLADGAIDELSLVAREYRAFAARPGGSLGSSIGDAALRSVESLVAERTGAEAALVFANPAAAMVAVLAALAPGREALASRSQIERLHGDFSLPAAAELAHARLREIGTTHRSTCDDFRSALAPQSAVILHSQPAEYRIAGSVAQAGLDELVDLAAQWQIPLVASLPAASLIPLHCAGAGQLPIVGQSIIAGADLVIFRGDTYVGGPACSIVAGRRDLIERIAAVPLATIMAADSFTLAALAATLRLHATPELAVRSIPLMQLLAASSDNLKHRAERLAPQIRHSSLVARVEVMPGQGWLNEARLPDERLSSWCLRIEARGTSAARLAGDLADRLPAVWALTEDNYLLLNLRSVLARQDEQIAAAFQGPGTRRSDNSDPSSEPTAASTIDVLSSAE